MPKRKVIKTDKPYRLKQVRGVWSAIDKKTGKSKSLKIQGTREEAEALADITWDQTDDTNAAFHMKTAEAHLAMCNPDWLTNTWRSVYEAYKAAPAKKTRRPKSKSTLAGIDSAWNHNAMKDLRDRRLLDTTAKHIETAAKQLGTFNIGVLRRLHIYALKHLMMPYAIMGEDMWPVTEESSPMSRAIKLEEHEQILKAAADESLQLWYRVESSTYQGMSKAETIAEWRDYLNLLWLVGCSQRDGAEMTAENINEELNCLEFKRCKWKTKATRKPVRVPIGSGLRTVLKRRPKSGPLFPWLTKKTTTNRARMFGWFVDWLKLPKVTLHGYRYAMAERLDEGGASDKDRMNMLGHAGRDMSEHYAKNSDYVPQCADIIDGAKAA